VQTDGVICARTTAALAGVKKSENLLALDLARVKRDVEMMSVVRSVAVERVLPHTLRLRVSERVRWRRFTFRNADQRRFEMKVLQMDIDGYVMTVLDPTAARSNGRAGG